MTHALEAQWWNLAPNSNIRSPIASFAFLKTVPKADQITATIGEHTAVLPTKWRPILCLLDICQLHALSLYEYSGGSGPICRHLFHLYGHLRLHILTEAEDCQGRRLDSWMPEVVHRMMVRIVKEVPHSPDYLQKNELELGRLYASTPPFSYGQFSSILMICQCLPLSQTSFLGLQGKKMEMSYWSGLQTFSRV